MAELFWDQIVAAFGGKKEPEQKGLLAPQKHLSMQEKLAVQPNLYQDFWTQNPAAAFNPSNPFAYSAAQKEAPEIAQNLAREIPIGLAATPGAVVDIAAAPFKGLLKGGLYLAGKDKLAEDIPWFPLAESSADAARNVIEGQFGKAPQLKSPEAISAELTGEAILDPMAAIGGVAALRETSKIPGLLKAESAIPAGPMGRPAVGSSGRPTGAIEYPAVPDANQVIAAERQAARVGPQRPVEPPGYKDPRVKAPIDPTTGMYSPVEEALLNLRQETMTPQQARSYLTNQGLSRGQLEDSGVWDALQWAQNDNQRVTKTGLLNTITYQWPQQEFQVRKFENRVDADVGLDWNNGQVIDDYEYIQANADDLLYDALNADSDAELRAGGGFYTQRRREIADEYANGDEELAQQVFEELEGAVGGNARNLSPDADEALTTWAETRARESYYDDPQYQWDFDVTGQGDYYTVRGSDDLGYYIEDPRGRQVGDYVWGMNEAEVRIREHALENYLINPAGETEWHGYTMGDIYRNQGPDALLDANYEEILVQAPPIRGGRDYTPSKTHWGDEENVIYHVRKTDRVGEEGEDVLFIEELQSDWHQAGRQKGYDKLSQQERKAKLSEFEQTMNKKGAEIKEIEDLFDAVGENPASNPRLYKRFEEIDKIRDPDAPPPQSPKGLSRLGARAVNDAITWKLGLWGPDTPDWVQKTWEVIDRSPELSKLLKARQEYRAAMEGNQAIRSMIPQGAFADDRWISQGMKQMLVKAAQEGKDGVAWTTGQHQVEQWTERSRKLYETLYDKKMPSAAKKLADEYGLKVKKIEVDGEEVMYLELNEKARKRIFERGIEMSSAAPLIPGAGLLADQQDNKQNQPKPGLLA